MAVETDPKPVTPAKVIPEAPFPMSIDEFCQDLSKKVKAPEMIYAFSKDEQKNGKSRDIAVNFQTRYEAFCGRVHA